MCGARMVSVSLNSSMNSNLLSLQSIAELQALAQNRLATGKKVNSAIDNPSAYYTSVSLNNRAQDLSQLLDAMSQGIQTLKAVSQALETGLDLLMQAQAAAKQALETAPVVLDRYWYEQQKGVSFVVENAGELLAAVNSGKSGNIVVLGDIKLDEEVVLQAGQKLVGIGYFADINGHSKDSDIDKYSKISFNDAGRGIVATDGSLVSDLSIKVTNGGYGIFSNSGSLSVHNVDIQGAASAGIMFVPDSSLTGATVRVSGNINIVGKDNGSGILAYSGNLVIEDNSRLTINANEGLAGKTVVIGNHTEIVSDTKGSLLWSGSESVVMKNNVGIEARSHGIVLNSLKSVTAGDNLTMKLSSDGNQVVNYLQDFSLGNNAKIEINVAANYSAINSVDLTAGDNLQLSVVGSYAYLVNSVSITAGNHFGFNVASSGGNETATNNFQLYLGDDVKIRADNVYFGSSSVVSTGDRAQIDVGLSADNTHTIFDFAKVELGKNSQVNVNAAGSYLASNIFKTGEGTVINFVGEGLATNGSNLQLSGTEVNAVITNVLATNGAQVTFDNSQVNIIADINNSAFLNNSSQLALINGSVLDVAVNGDNNNIFEAGATIAISADSKAAITTNGSNNNLFNAGGRHTTEVGAKLSYNDKNYVAVKDGSSSYYNDPTDTPYSEYFREVTNRAFLRSRVAGNDNERISAEAVYRSVTSAGMAKATAALAANDDGGQADKGVSIHNYAQQFNDILRQFDQLINDSGYKGVNLLRENDLQIVFSEGRSSKLSIKGINASVAGLGMVLRDWEHSSHVNRSLDELDKAVAAIRTYSTQFGNYYSIVSEREDFTTNLINVLTEGADKLTLADMNEESANMLALETRQLLAVNSLSLASQATQSILRLF